MPQRAKRVTAMRESDVEAWLVRAAKNRGGLAVKHVSPGRMGDPDRLVALPVHPCPECGRRAAGCRGVVRVVVDARSNRTRTFMLTRSACSSLAPWVHADAARTRTCCACCEDSILIGRDVALAGSEGHASPTLRGTARKHQHRWPHRHGDITRPCARLGPCRRTPSCRHGRG